MGRVVIGTTELAAAPIDVLRASATSLWPEADIALERGVAEASRAFLIVPSRRAPRLLIPVRSRAAASSIARYPAALTPWRGAARAGMATWLRLGGRAFGAGYLEVRGNFEGIDTYLAEVLGSPVVVSLGVGVDRINRKAVLGIFSPGGKPLAYAKVGETPYTAALVAREAQALDVLAGLESVTFRHPRRMHLGRWNGSQVLVSSFLPTDWWRVGRRRSVPAHIGGELADRFGQGPTPLGDTPLWSRVRESAIRLDDDRFLAAVYKVEYRWGSEIVRTTAWHGDLTRWNVGWGPGDTVSIWDWERFELGVPEGLDEVHWSLHSHSATTPEGICAHLERYAVAPPAIQAAYLVTMVERFLEGGPPGQARADRLLDAVGMLVTTRR